MALVAGPLKKDCYFFADSLRSRAVINRNIFLSEKTYFPIHACATCCKLPSNIRTMLQALNDPKPGKTETKKNAVLRYFIQPLQYYTSIYIFYHYQDGNNRFSSEF